VEKKRAGISELLECVCKSIIVNKIYPFVTTSISQKMAVCFSGGLHRSILTIHTNKFLAYRDVNETKIWREQE